MIDFSALWQREWQIKQQNKVQWLYPLVLFLIIITLFPLAMGTEPKLLQQLGVPAVWIAALLSLIMGMENLFRPALDNGTLAQLVVARASIPTWVLVRLIVHWLTSAGMVCLLAFLAMPLFGLTSQAAIALSASILVGSPILLCLSAIALPMQLPVLIFATGAVGQFAMGLNGYPILALLLAGSILAVIVTPFVIAFSLKLAWLS